MTKQILLEGTFTDDEISEVVSAIRRIEQRDPSRQFNIALDTIGKADASTTQAMDAIHKIYPAGETEPSVHAFYTRDQILDAVALRPCHVTGEHDPTHTTEYVCVLQMAVAFKGLLKLLGITEADLPRKLHDSCYWCNAEPKHHEELQQWVQRVSDTTGGC
jgi:hypothetical protein